MTLDILNTSIRNQVILEIFGFLGLVFSFIFIFVSLGIISDFITSSYVVIVSIVILSISIISIGILGVKLSNGLMINKIIKYLENISTINK